MKNSNNFLFAIISLALQLVSLNRHYFATSKEQLYIYGVSAVIFFLSYMYFSYKWYSNNDDDEDNNPKPGGGVIYG